MNVKLNPDLYSMSDSMSDEPELFGAEFLGLTRNSEIGPFIALALDYT
jgi:hypothetical protein